MAVSRAVRSARVTASRPFTELEILEFKREEIQMQGADAIRQLKRTGSAQVLIVIGRLEVELELLEEEIERLQLKAARAEWRKIVERAAKRMSQPRR